MFTNPLFWAFMLGTIAVELVLLWILVLRMAP